MLGSLSPLHPSLSSLPPGVPPLVPLQGCSKHPDLVPRSENTCPNAIASPFTACTPTPQHKPAVGQDQCVLPRRALPIQGTQFLQQSGVAAAGMGVPGLLLTGWVRQVFLQSCLLFQAAGEEIALRVRLGSVTLEQSRELQQGGWRAAPHGHPSNKWIPTANNTPTDPPSFAPRCNTTFHKMRHAHIYTTD